MRPETILHSRPDTFSQTVLVATDSSCSSAADHTCFANYERCQLNLSKFWESLRNLFFQFFPVGIVCQPCNSLCRGCLALLNLGRTIQKVNDTHGRVRE